MSTCAKALYADTTEITRREDELGAEGAEEDAPLHRHAIRLRDRARVRTCCGICYTQGDFMTTRWATSWKTLL